VRDHVSHPYKATGRIIYIPEQQAGRQKTPPCISEDDVRGVSCANLFVTLKVKLRSSRSLSYSINDCPIEVRLSMNLAYIQIDEKVLIV
jgi:hypothetical protein